MNNALTEKIRKKNDTYRTNFLGCRIVMTPGVAERSDLNRIIWAVRTFNAFTVANDPHKEHDFAFFSVHGEHFFWKFDYCDEEYKYFKEDGRRVLTVGLANEY